MYYTPPTLGMRLRMPGFVKALSALVFAVIAIACGSDSGTSTAEPDSALNPPPHRCSRALRRRRVLRSVGSGREVAHGGVVG